MDKKQEPKYNVDSNGKIINRVSRVTIPDDEPVMIFRARDKNAAPMIAYYAKLCTDEQHKAVVKQRLHDFVDFIHDHPKRMKEPDTALPTPANKLHPALEGVTGQVMYWIDAAGIPIYSFAPKTVLGLRSLTQTEVGPDWVPISTASTIKKG